MVPRWRPQRSVKTQSPTSVAVDGDVVVVDPGVVVVAEQAAFVGVGGRTAGPAAVSGVVALALVRGEVTAGVDAATVVGVQRPPARLR